MAKNTEKNPGKDQQRILTTREIQKILVNAEQNKQKTSIDNSIDSMMIKTCLYHGLRNQETVTLQRRHVDLDSKLGVNIERKNTKSDDGVRFVPTLNHFKEEFRNYVEKRTEKQEDYLFPSNRTNKNLSTQYFRDLLLDLAWVSSLYPGVDTKEKVRETVPERRRVRPHALRHTYGTRMYENGVPGKECADVMGHKDVETFLNLYAHLATERSRDVLDQAASQWD